FTGSAQENNPDPANGGVPGCTGGAACWGISDGSTLLPLIYDRFTEAADGRDVINTAVFPNPSIVLHSILTSDGTWTTNGTTRVTTLDPTTGIYWNGPQGIVQAGGGSNRPRLDAKSPFDNGSNYSHLNENIYPPGNVHSPITRELANRGRIPHPG